MFAVEAFPGIRPRMPGLHRQIHNFIAKEIPAQFREPFEGEVSDVFGGEAIMIRITRLGTELIVAAK